MSWLLCLYIEDGICLLALQDLVKFCVLSEQISLCPPIGLPPEKPLSFFGSGSQKSRRRGGARVQHAAILDELVVAFLEVAWTGEQCSIQSPPLLSEDAGT